MLQIVPRIGDSEKIEKFLYAWDAFFGGGGIPVIAKTNIAFKSDLLEDLDRYKKVFKKKSGITECV